MIIIGRESGTARCEYLSFVVVVVVVFLGPSGMDESRSRVGVKWRDFGGREQFCMLGQIQDASRAKMEAAAATAKAEVREMILSQGMKRLVRV